jgi:hypothetical protein
VTGIELGLSKPQVTALANRTVAESSFDYGGSDLQKNLQSLREATGVEFALDSVTVEKRAAKIVVESSISYLGRYLMSLREATGVEFVVDPAAVRARAEKMAAKENAPSACGSLKSLREVTGIELGLSKPQVTALANRTVAESSFDDDSSHLQQNLQSLREATGVEFSLDRSVVEKRAAKVVAESNITYLGPYLTSLREVIGVEFAIDRSVVEKRAAEIVVESSMTYLGPYLATLREATGVEFSLDRSVVEKRAAEIVAESSISYIGSYLVILREATGVEFVIDPAVVRTRAEKMAEACDISHLVHELESLSSAVNLPIPFNDALCSRALSRIVSISKPGYMKSHLEKLRDAFGAEITISPTLVEQRLAVIVRDVDISNIARDIKNLREATGVDAAIDPDIVNERARAIVMRMEFSVLSRDLALLRAAVNMEYVINPATLDKLVANIVSNRYGIDSAVLNIGYLSEAGLDSVFTDQNSAKIANCFVANGSIRNFSQGFEALRKACGGFVVDPAAVQGRAKRIASDVSVGDRPAQQLSILREATDVLLGLDAQTVSKLANRLLAEDNIINLSEDLKFLREATGVELEFDQAVLNARADKIVVNGRIGSLDTLAEVTGMKPDLNPASVKERATAIITNGDIQYMARELRTLHAASGIQFDFDPLVVEQRARTLIKQDHPRQLGGDLIALREATGVEFAVDPVAVRDRAKEILDAASIFDIAQSIEDLRIATQIDLALDADMIRNRAAQIVAGVDPSIIVSNLQGLHSATGIEFDLSPEIKTGVENRAAVAAQLYKLDIAQALKQISAIEVLAGPFLEDYLDVFASGSSAPKSTAILISNAQRIFELRSKIKERSVLASFTEKLDREPWGRALSSLLKRQHWVSRDEYNPWKSELAPLLTTLISNGEFDFENTKSARDLQEFIERFGFVNLPAAYRLVRVCVRAENPKAMPPEAIAGLSALNIDVSKFSSGRDVLNAFNQTFGRFQGDLLSDKLPPGWDSPLGKEIVSRLKGSTQWSGGNDDVVSLVKIWERTVRDHPELGTPPSWQKDGTLQVRLLKRRSSEVSEAQAEAIEAFWGSEEVEERYYGFTGFLDRAFNSDPIAWWKEERDRYAESIVKDRRQMDEYMMATDAWWDRAIQNAADEETGKKLSRMRQRLANPKARAGIEQNIRQLEADEAAVRALDISGGDTACVEVISNLCSRRGGPQLQGLIKAASAIHLASVAPEGWRETMTTLFSEGDDASLPRLEGVVEFIRQYVSEHYLHADQDPAHTNHEPLPEEARRRLVSLWQVQPGGKQFPIEEVRDKARRLLGIGGETEKRGQTMPVRMRPVAGLFYILSGDVGDACYTSKHSEMAAGKFPNVRAWIYTSGGEKSPEVIRGSILGIRAEEKGTKVPVLVARANNPRQNFISSVDADDFVLQSLQTVIESARELAKNQEKSEVKVVLPLDAVTASCTNRTEVGGVYNRFRFCKKIALVETRDTNFKYPIWDKSGGHACGVIWEMTPDGQEHWYGDWNQPDKQNS